uniref:LIM zinc-binding domain-containing protein n=1 Tax=Spumella elongata TaxID=89044 RepID=A0A7S3M5F1_9STRA|mmetsp:Transcript_29480/g.50561  ORF Transcript_29480/g.50561 Transcript_29480/m.50561 type:complete len:443 (+) Transcript_29480:42-1370(+)|eukprot:CAMPEP_0184993034 /NCGR_PEP_ID=MMETSP1098-20130426/43730_1 /TAXON_ID=89044 /ORGANISM="Spumella elongata, Strain CCAP 955/1" /LENGTH=442 /DNA_ID=CAMNT_0027518793 /DNA_START=42 /DNA_END=1370 /DNA_ORIENTATION=-
MKKGGSAALAAMIKKKSAVLYGSQDAGDNLEGTSSGTAPLEPEVKPVKYQPTTTTFSGASKCYICEKTVYKTEEVIAIGHTWHNTCFTCGGSAGDGCGRVLRRDGYTDHNSQPYCTACSSKLFKPKGYGHGTALNLDTGVPAPVTESPARPAPPAAAPVVPTPPPPAPPVPPAPVAPKSPEPVVTKAAEAAPAAPASPIPKPVLKDIQAAFVAKEETKPVKYTPKTVTMAFNSTPKCTICNKSVYKMEEMVAVGHIWHLNCFTCGGRTNDGCKRVLKRDGYVDHENNPFCTTCHSKLFRPKGFGYGNTLNTDYGPAPSAGATEEVTSGVAKLSTTAPVEVPPPAPKAPATPEVTRPAPPAPAVPAPAPAAVSSPAATAKKPAAPAAPVASPSAERKPVAGVTAPTAPGGHVAIGASSRAAGGVFKEAGYVGDNDEVDESEWD